MEALLQVHTFEAATDGLGNLKGSIPCILQFSPSTLCMQWAPDLDYVSWEEISGGAFCQYRITGTLTQVGNVVSGSFDFERTNNSAGTTCVTGEWNITNGMLDGNQITVTGDGVTAVFTVAGGNARIFGDFDFNEGGVSGTVSVNINRA